MNTKFNCPRCNAAVESDSAQAGLAGDCPGCGELLIVPANPQNIPRATVQRQAPPARSKTADEHVADAVCTTAKVGWKFAKWLGPILGKAALRVTARAATVAAPPVAKFIEGTAKGVVSEVKKKPGFSIYVIIRSLFG